MPSQSPAIRFQSHYIFEILDTDQKFKKGNPNNNKKQ